MKKLIKFALIIPVVMVMIFIDFFSKRDTYAILEKEYRLSNDWKQTEGLIGTYFYDHGYYPDSLEQIDDRFNHEVANKSFEDIRETEYRNLIDPFSRTFYHYIPIIDTAYKKPVGYYLLSAGIDSKINNRDLNSSELKLYDSLTFSYFDFYFGKRDLLVAHNSIEDVIANNTGYDYSEEELLMKYNSNKKRVLYRMINIYGVVERVDADYLLITEPKSKLKSWCNFALVPNHKSVALGDTVQVKGSLKEIKFKPDTLLVFLNCSVLVNK